MKTRWWAYEHDGLDYFKFSIYRFGTNMQTVYMYRMGDVLIDTAQGNSRRNVIRALDGKTIETILITHHHEDHAGNAAAIQNLFGSKVKAHAFGAKKLNKGVRVSPLGRLISGNVEKVKTDIIKDGEILDFGKHRLQVVHTPGHTNDHLAFHEPDKGWLFSGDLYVADRIKYFESNEAIDVQIASIRKMIALDFDVLLCSHNPKVKGGKKRLTRKLQLFEDFYGNVAKKYHSGMSAREIFEATGRKENIFYKYITIGQFTAINMVKSVIRAEKSVKNE
ncbi:MAG: MBL fold metallo-hydrolase [Bacteroidetes bacterium]|nr:MBL fold metallo-hydrolase [Bacteroidota bacterium]